MQYAPRTGELPRLASTPDGVVAAIASGLPLVLDARVETKMVQKYESALSLPLEPALVLDYDVAVASPESGASAQALWQGNLFAGAVADVYELRGFGTIYGAYATRLMPDGSRDYVGGGLGNTVPNQLFDDPPASLGKIAAKAGAEFGLRNVQASTVRAIQPSVVLIATTDTPVESVNAVRKRGALDKLLGCPEDTSKATTSSCATPQAPSSTAPAQPVAPPREPRSSTHPSESKLAPSSRGDLANPIVQGSFRGTGQPQPGLS